MNVEETRKKSSPSYLIRKNLQYLENTAKKAVEQGIELCGKKPPVELNYEETTEWLKQQKSDVGKQIIVLDGIISKANNLEKLKGLLRSLGEWENDLHYTKNIEPEEMRRCMELEKAFRQQNVIKVSRWTPQECSEIHIFVDTSQRAVGLAVYSRRSNSTPGEPKLIYGKTRIDEIKRSEDIEFRHARSACNPADLASRGLLSEKLRESSLWWNGPSWLSKPKERWPEDEIMEENIMKMCMAMGLMEEETIQSEQVCTTLVDVARFSSLRKLMRTILYVLRFIAKVSREKIRSLIGFSKENFTSKEYDRATQLIVKMAQLNTTRKEIEHWGPEWNLEMCLKA
uniref:Uncharacterized protein n=1 Tax=Wuchereria bancrofti TaxID=6293 RepID=A0AAF5PUB8_WUCBA